MNWEDTVTRINAAINQLLATDAATTDILIRFGTPPAGIPVFNEAKINPLLLPEIDSGTDETRVNQLINTALDGLTAADVGTLSTAEINAAISGITASDIGTLTTAEINTAIDGITAADVGSPTIEEMNTAISGITAADVGTLSTAEINTAIGGITAADVGTLSTAEINTAIGGITAADVGSPTTAQLDTAINGVNATVNVNQRIAGNQVVFGHTGWADVTSLVCGGRGKTTLITASIFFGGGANQNSYFFMLRHTFSGQYIGPVQLAASVGNSGFGVRFRANGTTLQVQSFGPNGAGANGILSFFSNTD